LPIASNTSPIIWLGKDKRAIFNHNVASISTEVKIRSQSNRNPSPSPSTPFLLSNLNTLSFTHPHYKKAKMDSKIA
jgi:hypothetical protein